MAGFFASYPSFTLTPNTCLHTEFARLAQVCQWNGSLPSKKYGSRLFSFFNALEVQAGKTTLVESTFLSAQDYIVYLDAGFWDFSAAEGAGYKGEFDKLMAWKGRKQGSKTYVKAWNQFLRAREEDIKLKHAREETEIQQKLGGLNIGNGGSETKSPLEEFFAKFFPYADYDRSKHFKDEFDRLCQITKLKSVFKVGRRLEDLFFEAVEEQFEWEFSRRTLREDEREGAEGVRLNKPPVDSSEERELQPWKSLCLVLGIKLVRGSKTEFKKALKGIFVNIFDLVDYLRTHGTTTTATKAELKRFPNLAALARYSDQYSRVFPLRKAKENEMLKFMLKMLSKKLN